MSRRRAENGPNGKGSSQKSDRFLQGLQEARSVTLISHVYPDPDSLGSMLGLAHLIQGKLKKPVTLTRDGVIQRAENRAFVELLEFNLVPVEEYTWAPGDAIVMVDSQPNTGRHSHDPSLPIYAVIDHHDTPGDLDDVPFVDIRQGIGANCSIVTHYLKEQDVPISKRIASALFYGIETELTGYPRNAAPLDEHALNELYPNVDRDLIARIRNAQVPQCYFECLLQALQSSFIYDRLIISWVNEMPQPELAAEVVDFLIRFDAVDWAVCAGVYQEQLILSVRTRIHGSRAGEILRQVVGKMGRAGGHDRRAGGNIPLESTSASAIEEVQGELRRRLLKALRIEECRGQRLVPLREMLQNLHS